MPGRAVGARIDANGSASFFERWYNGLALRERQPLLGPDQHEVQLFLAPKTQTKLMPDFTLPTATFAVDPNLARFLLEFGQEFEIRRSWPKDLPLPRGQMGECYKSASDAIVSSDRLVYCEGIACCPKSRTLLPHAWVYDLHTRSAYDPTWPDGSSYFGVPVQAKYLWQAQVDSGIYEVVNNQQDTWPITRASPDQWRDQRVAVASPDTPRGRMTKLLLDQRVRQNEAGLQPRQAAFRQDIWVT